MADSTSPFTIASRPGFWSEVDEATGLTNFELSSRKLAAKFGGDDGHWRALKRKVTPPSEDNPPAYKETVEFKSDGSCTSDKLIKMSKAQSKDPEFLLTAHGFDIEEWEIVNAKNAMWHVFSKDLDGEHRKSVNYSSKITVRPRVVPDFNIADVAEVLRAAVTPIERKRPTHGEKLLEISCVDMHLGNSTFDWYADNLERILEHIESRIWKQIVIGVGSDLFHCDNFKNTTSNGTLQSSVAWPDAWRDALRFYSHIIEASLEHGIEVYAYYIIGNHDESMAWAFCQALSAKYPQVRFDLDIDERKVHRWEDVAIGMTHGDGRTRKDLDRIFTSEFDEFSSARIREVHAGHHHHEVTVDQYGVVVRSLSTAARTDKWHREEGYVGAMKRFQIFHYEPDALRGVEYV